MLPTTPNPEYINSGHLEQEPLQCKDTSFFLIGGKLGPGKVHPFVRDQNFTVNGEEEIWDFIFKNEIKIFGNAYIS